MYKKVWIRKWNPVKVKGSNPSSFKLWTYDWNGAYPFCSMTSIILGSMDSWSSFFIKINNITSQKYYFDQYLSQHPTDHAKEIWISLLYFIIFFFTIFFSSSFYEMLFSKGTRRVQRTKQRFHHHRVDRFMT
jgi:hypothetical protein